MHRAVDQDDEGDDDLGEEDDLEEKRKMSQEQCKKVPRGAEVTHTTFTQETRVCIPHYMFVFLSKLNK